MTSYLRSAIESLTTPARQAVVAQAQNYTDEKIAFGLASLGVSPARLRTLADRMSAQGEQFVIAVVHDTLHIIEDYCDDFTEDGQLLLSALDVQPWSETIDEFVLV